MRWFFFTRVGLAAWVLSAALLLPERASAQRLPQQESLSLSAAIEEAKRGPFHVRDGVSGSVAPGTEPTAHFWSGANFLVAGQETGDEMPVDGPSARKVFLATAIAAPVANAVGLALVGTGLGIATLSMVGEDSNDTTWLLSLSLYSHIHSGATTFFEHIGR